MGGFLLLNILVYYKRRSADVPKKKFSDSCSRHERVIVAILAFNDRLGESLKLSELGQP